MAFLLRLALFACLIIAAPLRAQEDVSLSDLSGIPVMEGLSEVADERVIFDKPEGRIVQAVFTGGVARADAVSFYRETLHQLGWAEAEGEEGALVFSRDDEKLTLTVSEGAVLRIRFELSPSV